MKNITPQLNFYISTYFGIKKAFIFLLLCSLSTPVFAFELSGKAQISLITGEAGQDAYAIFGHSALRIQDPMFGIDVLYNYGTFDFDTPNFYIKFARRKLLYILSKDNYAFFVQFYASEGRGVSEQVLNLEQKQKHKRRVIRNLGPL